MVERKRLKDPKVVPPATVRLATTYVEDPKDQFYIPPNLRRVDCPLSALPKRQRQELLAKSCG